MRKTVRRESVGMLLTLALAAALLAAAPAFAGSPVGKVYGCYTYTGGPAGISLVDAIQVKSRTRYLVAPSYRKHRLNGRAASGRYRLHGNKLAFLTGPFKGMFGAYGRNHGAGLITLFNHKHEPIDVSCYQV